MNQVILTLYSVIKMYYIHCRTLRQKYKGNVILYRMIDDRKKAFRYSL